jgi:hypothetical protein
VRAAPDDAEALLRYANALDEAGRVDDALATIVHGAPAVAPPRRLPVLWKEATLHRKKKDLTAEIAALDAAVALFPATPRSPHFDSVRKQVEARRAAL